MLGATESLLVNHSSLVKQPPPLKYSLLVNYSSLVKQPPPLKYSLPVNYSSLVKQPPPLKYSLPVNYSSLVKQLPPLKYSLPINHSSFAALLTRRQVTRLLEVYKTYHSVAPLRVYYLSYSDSVEEQRYLSQVRREADVSFKRALCYPRKRPPNTCGPEAGAARDRGL